MYRTRLILSLCFVVTLSASCRMQPETSHPPSRSFPDLDRSAMAPSEPELVAPGFISTHNGERDAAFLPDHSAFYYTLWTGRFGVIVELKKQRDGWSNPAVASFSGRYSDLEPFVTADGSRLYFASDRPVSGEGDSKDYDIWYVERADTTWGPAVRLSDSVNTAANEFYPSLDRDETLYFTAAYDHGAGGEDIWLSRPVDGSYTRVENAGAGVNTERDEFNSVIAPDGSFLVYSSFGRPDGLGGGDLYVSFRGEDGQLGPAVHPSAPLNSPALDFSPALTPDGGTLFFSSRRSEITVPRSDGWSFEALVNGLSAPGNGNLDLYRVDADLLLGLKPAN